MIHQINTSALNTVILWSAVRAMAIGCFAAMVLTIFRVRTTSLRLFAWKSVLATALALPLLGLLLPPVLIPSPALLQSSSSAPDHQSYQQAENVVTIRTAAAIHASRFARFESPASKSQASSSVPVTAPVVPSRPAIQIAWPFVVTIIYLTGALFLIGRLVIGYSLSRKLVRASVPITDARIRRIVSAHPAGLGRAVVVAESELISVPVTVGAIRSTVLLPTNWREWDDTRLDAVIAHELSHVARHDAFTQHASLLHRAIFWFSPFAWWLDRHLAALAEQASDEAALAAGADRNAYAKILLGFFEALQAGPGRVWWHGVSMANGGKADQRLERILSWKGAVPMGVRKSFIAVIAILAVPVVYLAASARPVNVALAQAAAPPAPSTVPMSPTVPAVIPDHGPIHGIPAPAIVSDAPAAPGVAGIAPIAPTAAIPPSSHYYGARSQSSGTSSGSGYSYAYGYDDEDRFVIVSGKSDSYTMSGSSQDIRHVERLKKQIGADFIWFQRDEKSYIIRDQATIDRAKAFWAPQEELGRKQEELGKKQEALGKQQEELGRKQEQVRVNVPPDLTAKLDALKAKLQKLGPTASMDEIGDLQSEIGDLQGQIGEIQGKAGEQQGRLGEEQGKLGEQQGKLGEEQGKLGEEQGRLAEEAVKKTKALFDECIKNGKAQPEQESSGGASL